MIDRFTEKETAINKAYQVVTSCSKCEGEGFHQKEEIKIELAIPEKLSLLEEEIMRRKIKNDRQKDYIRRHSWENPKNSSYGLCKCYIQYEFIKNLILAEIPLRFQTIGYTDILPRNINIDGDEKKSLHDFVKRYIEKFNELKKNSVGLNLIGKIGTGKTFISQMIGAQIAKKRYSVHYIPFFYLAKMVGSYEQTKLLSDIFDVDFLIIDEIGSEHPNRRGFSGEISYLIQKRIQSKKPSIFCINGFPTNEELIEAYGGTFFATLDERNITIKFNNKAISKKTRKKYFDKVLGDI